MSEDETMNGWVRQNLQRCLSLLRAPQLDGELEAEVAAHLQLAIEENLRRGMPAAEARRQALLRLGGETQTKERQRETRGKFSLLGIMLGILGAIASMRILSSQLYGVSPADPATLASVAALVAAVALSACYIPARRAMLVDPIIALRYE